MLHFFFIGISPGLLWVFWILFSLGMERLQTEPRVLGFWWCYLGSGGRCPFWACSEVKAHWRAAQTPLRSWQPPGWCLRPKSLYSLLLSGSEVRSSPLPVSVESSGLPCNCPWVAVQTPHWVWVAQVNGLFHLMSGLSSISVSINSKS